MVEVDLQVLAKEVIEKLQVVLETEKVVELTDAWRLVSHCVHVS